MFIFWMVNFARYKVESNKLSFISNKRVLYYSWVVIHKTISRFVVKQNGNSEHYFACWSKSYHLTGSGSLIIVRVTKTEFVCKPISIECLTSKGLLCNCDQVPRL